MSLAETHWPYGTHIKMEPNELENRWWAFDFDTVLFGEKEYLRQEYFKEPQGSTERKQILIGFLSSQKYGVVLPRS